MTTANSVPEKSLRLSVQRLVEQPRFVNFILALIILNAILLGLETSKSVMAEWGPLLVALDHAMLTVFTVELLLRIYAWRGRFFTDAWSIFDLVVVVIALVPASGPFAVLRALRVLRVLRLLTIVPSMRRVVSALLGALPGLGSIAMLLMLVYYVFAVIATKLFGESFPDWFGTLGRSLYTLFQVMTLESWSMGISRPIMEKFPYAWVFFIPFILVATFTMLNLFIAIIVNAMQSFTEAEHAVEEQKHEQAEKREQDYLHAELGAIRAELRQLREQLAREPARPARP